MSQHDITSITIPPPDASLYCDFKATGAGPFKVRPARAGDKIVPFGGRGTMKVQEILRAENIPPHKRDYPVITSAGEIVAVPPFRIADKFKITGTTEKVIEFRFSGLY